MKFTLLVFLFAVPALADFSYQETTRITGGSLMSMMNFAGAFSKSAGKAMEPKQTTIAVKGNRMSRRSPDSLTITDLDAETITTADFAKKTYTVMTFEQMRQAMNDMQSRMAKQQGAAQPGGAQDASNMQFDVKVNETGNAKSIGGNDAHEVIMTISVTSTDAPSGAKGGMKITSDMWLSPSVPGWDEIAEFYKKMAKKMDWMPQMNPAMASRPGMSQGMARMVEETAKLKGLPVLKVTKMDAMAEGVPQDGAVSQRQPQQQQQSSMPPTAISGALGGMLASRMKKRQADAAAANGNSNSASSSLMEMTEETTGFSGSVDASAFSVPAGFKQVESQMMRGAKGDR